MYIIVLTWVNIVIVGSLTESQLFFTDGIHDNDTDCSSVPKEFGINLNRSRSRVNTTIGFATRRLDELLFTKDCEDANSVLSRLVKFVFLQLGDTVTRVTLHVRDRREQYRLFISAGNPNVTYTRTCYFSLDSEHGISNLSTATEDTVKPADYKICQLSHSSEWHGQNDWDFTCRNNSGYGVVFKNVILREPHNVSEEVQIISVGVGIEINLSDDIDQCQARANIKTIREHGKSPPIRRCHPKTQCVLVADEGSGLDRYRCLCQEGFCIRGIANFTRLSAATLQREYEDYLAGQSSLFEDDSVCLPCPVTITRSVKGLIALSSIMGLELPIALVTITSVMMIGVLLLMTLTYRNRQNKILKAASPGLLMITLIGAFLLYGEIVVVAFNSSTFTCMLRAWIRHFGFVLAYSGLLFKTWRISVIMRLFNSRLFQTRDAGLYKKIAMVTATCLLFLTIWSLLDPVKVLRTNHNHLSYPQQCMQNWWNVGAIAAEFLYLIWGGMICFQARKAPDLYNETRHISYVIWNEGLWLIFMLLFRFQLYRHPDPEMLLVVTSIRTHVTVAVLITIVFGSKFYVMFRNVRHLRGTLTDVYGPKRIHRMSLMVNKNGEIKTIYCVPCGPLAYLDSSDVDEDTSSQDNTGSVKEDVYTKAEVDALIEMVSRLKAEKETYKLQTQRLLQILKFKRFKETHMLPQHGVNEEPEFHNVGLDSSILSNCIDYQNETVPIGSGGGPGRSGRASTVTTYISSSPDSTSLCENVTGRMSPLASSGQTDIKLRPNSPVTCKPCSVRFHSSSPHHDVISGDVSQQQSAISSKKSDDTDEFPKLINSNNSNNKLMHSHGITALYKGNVCAHPPLDVGRDCMKTSQMNIKSRRQNCDLEKPNFIMYI